MSATEGRIPTIGLTLNYHTIIAQIKFTSTKSKLNNVMGLEIKTAHNTKGIKITNLDRITVDYQKFVLEDQWYKILIPCMKHHILDIRVHGESIAHCLNSGVTSSKGYELWIHGDLSQYFARLSRYIAHDDLMRFKDLKKKYLITESWNEKIKGDFVPPSVRNFFAKGDGPHWYHKDDVDSLPYLEYEGPAVDTNINLEEDLQFSDTKFYGQGKCKSLKANPNLPTMPVSEIKNQGLRSTMEQFGFTDMLQMQYVELMPNSWLPVHMDDWTYDSGRNFMKGPVQLYFVLSGDTKNIKFKFKNVGLLNVENPIFINNQKFVHSLVYTGDSPRGVLLAYGNRKS